MPGVPRRIYVRSHPLNPYPESFYHTPLLTEMMLLSWTSGHMASEVCNNRVHSSMYESLTSQMSSCYRCHEQEKQRATSVKHTLIHPPSTTKTSTQYNKDIHVPVAAILSTALNRLKFMQIINQQHSTDSKFMQIQT